MIYSTSGRNFSIWHKAGLSFGSSERGLRDEMVAESVGMREGSGSDDKIERARAWR